MTLPLDPLRWFPIRSLPYIGISRSLIESHRSDFELNHGLSLEQLADQGGLDWIELWAGLHGEPLFPSPRLSNAAAMQAVMHLAAAWSQRTMSDAGHTDQQRAAPAAAPVQPSLRRRKARA